jgi:flagellar motor protein MotB
MQNHRLFLVLSLCLVLLLASSCRTAPRAEPADVETAAWVTPDEVPEPSAESQEFIRLREENRRMNQELEDIRNRVKALDSKPAPAAAEPAPAEIERAPAAAPIRPSGEEIAAAIRRAGIPDLEVDLNRHGEAFIRLSGSIAFRSGQADLRGQANDRLKRLVNVLRREFPDIRLRVEGHTDSDPIRKSKWASNESLSMARAKAVSNYLTSTLGWPADSVISQGYGSERPIATNSTREGKARNRRIEIVLIQ